MRREAHAGSADTITAWEAREGSRIFSIMSRMGTKSVVYHGDSCIGEAEVFPVNTHHFQFPNNEIRISHLSPPSERCPPLSVLQTISPLSVRCKIQCKSVTDQSLIHRLYISCFQELKTAVVLYGDEELHLVAMPTKVEKFPCFWCCSVPLGLYGSCLGMLNLRCLAIVFDLDETLIVANTMKSFEDRIEILSRRIDGEDDPVRVSGMSAELKRYLEDKALLKQYIENDNVLDNGRFIVSQNEEIPPLNEGQGSVIRPIIRLQEKNVVLTRINPEIRDTSVLVRLRTAWEDLRSYLIAKGRKRFEVFVCTLAERDYALEMWRLLDPEAHLICSKNLVDRVVCVKSGSRKSLLNVFQDASCHPKMAMVIDDRLNVWDNKDQPRVHVVPAFAPYYAPQAEIANAVPVLCVARNVACNVRGGFFKEFDENLLRRIFEFYYEDDILDLPSAPDVGDYLTPEDANVVPNGNKDVPISDGMNDAEVERRSNQLANTGNGRQAPQQANSTQSSFLDGEVSINRAPVIYKDIHTKAASLASFPSSIFIAALQEIGRRCDSKVEFRSVISSSKDLRFSVEVLFSAEKIGFGMGRTWKEAHLHAAENALHYLANNYIAFIAPDTGAVDRDLDKLSLENENGFLKDTVSLGSELLKEDVMPNASISEQLGQADDAKKISVVVSEIKELCPTDGHSLVFHDQAPAFMNLCEGHYYSQVEISGRVLGKGMDLSRDGATLMAAEEALSSLKVTVQQTQKRLPRSSSSSSHVPMKRSKVEEDISQGTHGL